jgi:hypothetical protein
VQTRRALRRPEMELSLTGWRDPASIAAIRRACCITWMFVRSQFMLRRDVFARR